MRITEFSVVNSIVTLSAALRPCCLRCDPFSALLFV